MPSKKGSQSKEQQTQQQSQQQPVLSSSTNMTGPTAAATAAVAGKPEASQQLMQLLQENSDPVTVVMSVVDKKVRNLDKRKVIIACTSRSVQCYIRIYTVCCEYSTHKISV